MGGPDDQSGNASGAAPASDGNTSHAEGVALLQRGFDVLGHEIAKILVD